MKNPIEISIEKAFARLFVNNVTQAFTFDIIKEKLAPHEQYSLMQLVELNMSVIASFSQHLMNHDEAITEFDRITGMLTAKLPKDSIKHEIMKVARESFIIFVENSRKDSSIVTN